MFSKEKKTFLVLAVLALLLNTNILYAAESNVASVDIEALPINTASSDKADTSVQSTEKASSLVSPSKAKEATAVAQGLPSNEASTSVANKPINKESASTTESVNKETAPNTAEIKKEEPSKEVAPTVAPAANDNVALELPSQDDFNFDLRMKSINAPAAPVVSSQPSKTDTTSEKTVLTEDDLPKVIQYKTNPVENLGNSILSQMDDDLFSQMSEIEKSTTLLNLELRREKLRNEIEAQKAIRQKAADDLERQKREAKLKELERKKQIEAQVLQEKQVLADKQQLLEVLKQRKLLNAYMNDMLVRQQGWLKEKENLYAQLTAAEQEKKELTELFKQKVDTLVEASAKNMQAAKAAKANFERVIKGLKARNDQLRKRIEADAKIIKNAQNSLYQKSQSLEDLQAKTAAAAAAAQDAAETAVTQKSGDEEDIVVPVKLSAQYAILGITGRGDSLSIEVIDANGMPVSLKIGSVLPTGHILQEIGTDYAMFSLDGTNEYLHVGRTIDGIIPTLGLIKEK